MFVTSGFSFRTSIGKIKDIAKRLKELNYSFFPIADISSTWAFTEIKKEAKDAGLKPIYAVQIPVSPNPKAKKPVYDLWTFIARNEISAINSLVELSTSQFRYTPLLSYEQACAAEGVFIVTGHKSLFENFRPQENLFIGLSPACSKGYIKRAIVEGHKFCAAQVNRYVKHEDKQFWEIVCGRGTDIQTYPQWILSDDEWRDSVKHLFAEEKAEEETFCATIHLRNILDQCIADLPQADIIRPEGDLRQMCLDGAKKFGIDLSREGYMERLNHELEIIEDKKFEPYFFVVADLMQFARSKMLCGPGRGSSAGSLVCYCLGITSVDPIKHGLLFFRFIDPNRPDWPDIDSDLADDKRHLVWDYLSEKYGKDHFAKVGALAYYQTDSALKEACKALGVPQWEADKIQVEKVAAFDERKLVVLDEAFKNTIQGQAFLNKYPEMQIAADIVGSPTHSSTHAGGIVLTSEPISKYVAIDRRADSDTIQIDKDDAEKRGLIKIDLLGVKEFKILEETCNLAGISRQDLEKVPLDDPKAFETLNTGKYTSVFQFDGKAVKNLTKEIVVETLDDIAIISALARPGPLSSGAAGQWVKKRSGRIPVEYPHEILKPFLTETLGELVYQEQVMMIAHEVAGMDWKTVSKLRKAISKSQGETAVKEYGDPFIEGLVKAGIPDHVAAAFWRQILGFGSYGFNKSHAIAYGIVSYWSCWLKAHYPLEFAAASLSFRTKVETQIDLLRELAAEGVTYTPVDPENSTDKWRVVNGRLIGPISLVKGCGPKMTQQILSARSRGEPLPERAMKLLQSAVTPIDELFPIKNALRKIDLEAANILSKPTPCIDAAPSGAWQEGVLVLGCVRLCEPRDENDPKRIEDRKARGQKGVMTGETRFVEMRIFDDSGEIYAKIGRNEYNSLASKVLGVVEAGKTMIAIVGTVCPDAPVLLVKKLKIIGSL